MSAHTATAIDDPLSEPESDMMSLEDFELSQTAAQRLGDDPVTSLMNTWAEEKKKIITMFEEFRLGDCAKDSDQRVFMRPHLEECLDYMTGTLGWIRAIWHQPGLHEVDRRWREYSRHFGEFKIAIERVDEAETEDREESQSAQGETTPPAWQTIADEIAERLTKFEEAALTAYSSKVEKAKEWSGFSDPKRWEVDRRDWGTIKGAELEAYV